MFAVVPWGLLPRPAFRPRTGVLRIRHGGIQADAGSPPLLFREDSETRSGRGVKDDARRTVTPVDAPTTMTAKPLDGGRGRPRKPAALPPSPKRASLRDYTRVSRVVEALDISDKTILKWAADGTNGCPPVYSMSDKTRRMETAAVNRWIESRRHPVAEKAKRRRARAS